MYKPLYEDTDSVKYVTELTPAQRKEFMKMFLNSAYGAVITNYKENDKMTRDYIVVHEKSVSDGIRVGIVFTAKIAGITKDGVGNAVILLDSGYSIYCKDKYEDIVKQLV